MKKMRKIISLFICFLAFFLVQIKNVHASTTPVYWKISGQRITYLDQSIDVELTRIVFEDTSIVNHVITNADADLDISRAIDPANTVHEYIVGTELYIQFNGTLYLSSNSDNLFMGFPGVTSIDGLEYVNTSNVRYMNSMFSGDVSLTTIDLSHFNTSNVEDMGLLFEGLSGLTSINLSTFNTNNVTKMNAMFRGASSLASLNVSNFNTANVTTMAEMFKGMTSLTSLNVGNFSTANVTDMHSMFENIPLLTSLSVSNFSTTSVTNMHSMFKDLPLITTLNLSNFTTTNVTDMHSMFENDIALTSLNISSFNTNLVTNFSKMFKGLSNITTLNISSFRTPAATNLSYMFYNMSSLTSLDVSQWNTANVTDMSYLFYNVSSISSLSVTNFNTANVTNMSHMFEKLSISTIDVTGFNTASVTDMSYMFADMTNLEELELGNFNTSLVSDMEAMFYNDSSIEKIYVTSSWNTNSVTNSSNMFYNLSSITVLNSSTTYDPNETDKRYARIDRYNILGYFSVHWSVTSNIYEVSYDPYKIDALQNIFDISNVTFNNVTYQYYQAQEIIEVRYGNLILRRFNVIKPILSVTLDQHDVVLIRGRNVQLNEDIYPSDTTYSKVVTYTSSNTSILQVLDAQNGIIKGVAAGTATITVTTINGRTDGTNDSHTDTCTIEVIVPIDTFIINDDVRIIPEDQTVAASNYTYTLNPVLGPWDTTEDTTITWSSADTNIAVIDANGTITGKSPGTTTITGALNAGRFLTPQPNEQLLYGYSVTITIKILIPIDAFAIQEQSYTLYIGDENYESYTLTPDYTPPTGSYEENDTVTWSTDDASVVTVNQSTGRIHAEGPGTATITGTLYKGWTATSTITVKVLAKGLTTPNAAAPPDEVPMEIGQTFTFQTTITPSNSSYTHIDWSTNDPNEDIISIDQNGTVTAINYGHKVVTAILRNGLGRDITITRNIWVKKPIIDLSLEHDDYTLYIGDSTYDHTTVVPVYDYPDYEVDGSLEWTARNRRITVTPIANDPDHKAVITAVAKGTTSVTARATHYDQQFTYTADVLVKVLTLSFDISNQTANTTKNMEIGDTFTYQTAIGPDNTDYREVTWSTDDPNEDIISIDQNGVVTAIGYGTATVTATLHNGLERTIVVQRTIKVLKPIIDFDLEQSDYTLYIGDSTYDHVKVRPVYDYPDYEVDGSLEWTAGDNKITVVGGEDNEGYYGLVTAVSKGSTSTTARVIHYGNQFTSTANILIKVLTQSFNITNQTANEVHEMEIGDTFTYQTAIGPNNTDYREVTWSTDDPNENIISIDQNGVVTANGYGTATVTATLHNGLGRTIVVQRTIKVLIPVTSFDITETSIDLYVGDSEVDNATIIPVYSQPDPEVDKTVEWTSSDPTIASVVVDSNNHINGIITGNKEGTVTITARVTHYGQQFIDTMTVNVHVLALTFDITNQTSNTTKELEIGDTFEYQTAITPLDSSYTHIDWSTNDTNGDVITIDQTGKVTAVGYGTKTVTAILRNGLGRDITVTRDVKVLIPVTSFDITETSVDLYVGDSEVDNTTIIPQFSQPYPEVDKTVEWTSSDSTIASVVADSNNHINGIITGNKEGTVTITARVTHYGQQFIDTMTVNVHVLALTFDITNQTSNTTKELEIGDTFTYQTSITPLDSSYTHITWSSDNSNAASVDQNGVVTANAAGLATITAVLTNGLGRDITITRDIKVLIPVTSFDIRQASVDLYIGDTTVDKVQLQVDFSQPDPEVDKTIEWTTTDGLIATVSNSGLVEAKGEGTVTITGRVTHYGNQFIDTVTINVKVLALTFDITNQTANTTKNMEIGETFTYLTAITPLNSSYTNVTWSTNDTNGDVITIDQNGTVTAVGYGTKTVTAVLTNGLGRDITVTREVKVLVPVTSFELQETSEDLYIGDSEYDNITLHPIFSQPTPEVDKTIEWLSSDNSVATVSNGVVTATGEGTATISARVTHYGNQFIDTVTINVKVLALTFDITNQTANTTKNMEIGDTFSYSTRITPDTSSYTNVTWSTNDTNGDVITIDQNGTVTAVGYGTKTVTAVLTNGLGRDITVTREVKVLVPVTSFELQETSEDLYIGDSEHDHITLHPIFSQPTPEVDKSIDWSSSNNSVATVSNGVVTATGEGTATITARVIHYGNQFIDTMTVNVKVLALTFDITNQASNATKDMEIGDTFTYQTTIYPLTSSYTSVTWSTDDPNDEVITVNQNGTVTAIGAGTKHVTAVLTNGLGRDITVTREIRVLVPITGFSVTPTTTTLYRNDPSRKSIQLQTTITPSNYEVNGDITWTTTNGNVATVSNSGIVTGVGVGQATITGTLYNGMHVDTVVNVEAVIEEFILNNASSVTLELGGSHKINTTINPSDATESKVITWSSNNTSVADVDSTGEVTTNGTGHATITGTLGSRTVTVEVDVIISITSFTVSPTSVSLVPLATAQLTETIEPSNTTESKVVTWSSAQPLIADVNPTTGLITANAVGTTTITGILPSNRTVTVQVRVLKPIESITVSPSSASLYKGDSERDKIQLSTTILPQDAEEAKNVTWSTSDPSVATVTEEGLVRAVGNGPVTITATLPNGMGNNCNINVYSPITSFTVTNGTNIEMNLTQTHTINTSILPADTTDDTTITWTSDDDNIASVTGGVITAVGYGTTTITGTLATNQEVTIRVKVIKPITGVTISQSTLDLVRGDNSTDRATLTMNLVPPDATETYTVTWTTDDPNEDIISIDQNGLVIATGNGSATVTGTLSNGMSDTCTVNVTNPIRSFSIVGDTSIKMLKGRQIRLETSIVPSASDTTDDPTITWTSSDTTIATVTAAGIVTSSSSKTGIVTITGTLPNTMSVTVTIEVWIPLTSFSIGPANIEVLPGGTRALTASFTPKNTTESKVITWSSEDESIATVNDGVVTGVALGETTITAELENGMTATATVVVTNNPSQLKRGDFNKDDVVNINDVIIFLKKVFGYIDIKDDEDYQIGDLDNNDRLNISDVIILLKYVFGYIDSI